MFNLCHRLQRDHAFEIREGAPRILRGEQREQAGDGGSPQQQHVHRLLQIQEQSVPRHHRLPQG